MAGGRAPGSYDQQARHHDVDDGTAPRATMPPPGTLSPEDEETIAKVRRMRALAGRLGFPHAVGALDHFLDRTGAFVEIGPAKVQSVRHESEASHKEKLLKLVRSSLGARTVLALQALVDDHGKVKPVAQWPSKATVTMDYMSGVAHPGIDDDNLAYYGSMIKSVLLVECTRGEGRTYVFRIASWRSWVVDNYDWEGDKQFGGNNPFLRWLLPTQRQMNRLNTIGYARSYQRSSRSWQMPFEVAPWQESFATDEVVAQDAEVRRHKNQQRQDQETKDRKDGALPVPGPAEDVIQ
jgi:hypothetical protein